MVIFGKKIKTKSDQNTSIKRSKFHRFKKISWGACPRTSYQCAWLHFKCTVCRYLNVVFNFILIIY